MNELSNLYLKEFRELLNELDKASREYYKAKKQYKKILKEIALYNRITPYDLMLYEIYRGGMDGSNK